MTHNKTLIKWIALFSYVGMVTVNALANILPINGMATGAISDSYPNLFAPAGFTFSIWGLIYLLLAVYVGYQFIPKSLEQEKFLAQINLYFILSSLANSVWIFSWHYKMIGLSVILMLVILYSLAKISSLTNSKKLALKDVLVLKIPFGVYFGWITIATIANITTFLVGLGWKNFIFPDDVWMIIILLVGMMIASWITIREKNVAYGLVPVWAYFGIYAKHTSPLAFNSMYPNIIMTAVACMGILIAVNGFLVAKKNY
jgi:hypothetical protein